MEESKLPTAGYCSFAVTDVFWKYLFQLLDKYQRVGLSVFPALTNQTHIDDVATRASTIEPINHINRKAPAEKMRRPAVTARRELIHGAGMSAAMHQWAVATKASSKEYHEYHVV
jgi:hypothetical protein